MLTPRLLQRWQVLKQFCRNDADLVDGSLECVLGSRRRMLDSGDFADKLAGGLFDLVVRGVDAGGLAQAFD